MGRSRRLKELLMASVSKQREFAVQVVSKLRAAGHVALFAGGCVRDLLLGRESKDFDVATSARPDEVQTIFGRQKTLAVGASFGVIVVLGPRDAGQVEVATFRTEGPYLDGRHPEQVTFSTPEQDARRRDFTINGMFFDPLEDRVDDYVGGQADLSARIVRAIGNPHERVREDKLRMLRAVRFAATLDFSLDVVTADAIRDMSSELIVVSAERIAQELKKMLVDRHRRRAIELAEDVRLLRIILPELEPGVRQSDWSVTLSRLEALNQPSFELAAAALLFDLNAKPEVQTICRRLKLSNEETDRIVWLADHRSDLSSAPQLTLAALKRLLAHQYCPDLIELLAADLKAKSANLEPVQYCRQFLADHPMEEIDPPPFVTGDDLIALGLRPGPHFKQILDSIRDAQLNLQLKSRDEAIDMARQAILK